MATDNPFSPAAERNRGPILAVLQAHLGGAGDGRPKRLLEIGSGTGQHAVHMAAALPHWVWQCSELADQLPGLQAWLDEAGLPNTPQPWALDVAGGLPEAPHDAVFTANTLHIMGWPEVQRLFAGLPRVLAPGGLLLVYGPFNRGGQFTSPGNAAFDAALRQADPRRGLRDVAAVDALAQAAGLALVDDVAMPANNRCLVWRRTA